MSRQKLRKTTSDTNGGEMSVHDIVRPAGARVMMASDTRAVHYGTDVVASRAMLRVHVNTRDARVHAGLVTLLRRAGVMLVPQPDRSPETIVVAAGRTVDEAMDTCHPAYRSGDYRLLIVADIFSPAAVRRAVRAGVRAMLPSTGVTPAQLAAALYSARHGDGRMPYQVLVRLLNHPTTAGTAIRTDGAARPALSVDAALIEALTARQSAVLRLIADGHGNAAIARALSCSEHTVKNVIYDLMARLQVHNRAHAVARGIRAGLI